MNFFAGMKPFQLILLGVFAFFIILGLVLFAKYGGLNGSKTSVGTVTIWGTLPQSGMDPILNELQNSNQDYQGVKYVQKNEGTFDNDLAQAISVGQGPDLILISQEQLVTEQAKLAIVPTSAISERTYLDSYLPIFKSFLAADGSYGVPFAVDPLVLYYNRSALVQAGIATPPTTWEGITSLAEQLTSASAGTVSMSTIPFGSYDNVEDARAIVSLLLLQAGNTITAVSGGALSATLTSSSANGSPAQSALAFYTQFADPSKTVYTWNSAIPSARQAFLAGTLVFYPAFASERASLSTANPNLDFDMTKIPQPQNAQKRLTYAKAYAFGITNASRNQKGAETAALALANPSLAQTVSTSLGMAPATNASLVPSASDSFQPVYFPQALIAQGWLSPSPATTDTIFSTMIRNITSGSLSVGQALTTANQALNAAL